MRAQGIFYFFPIKYFSITKILKSVMRCNKNKVITHPQTHSTPPLGILGFGNFINLTNKKETIYIIYLIKKKFILFIYIVLFYLLFIIYLFL